MNLNLRRIKTIWLRRTLLLLAIVPILIAGAILGVLANTFELMNDAVGCWKAR